MADSQFCLEWDAHNKNICNGLSSLQQSGEFVDMTLAADGHHVKVHQMVMALASPYVKALIVNANCPHPVIFLNRVSYKTLTSILEYIYTGQALVAVEDISDLIIAAKELHIKGLEDVKAESDEPAETETDTANRPTEMPEIQIKLQRPTTTSTPLSVLSTLKRKLDAAKPSNMKMPIRKRPTILSKSNKDMPALVKDDDNERDKSLAFDDSFDDRDDFHDDDGDNDTEHTAIVAKKPGDPKMSVQYTISNQGSLQLILNRFLYFLYYQYRDHSRQWRCVDNRNSKCMASVFTKDNIVLRRVGAHNHSFHDKNILKKVRAGAVYSALQEAEAKSTKRPRAQPATIAETSDTHADNSDTPKEKDQ